MLSLPEIFRTVLSSGSCSGPFWTEADVALSCVSCPLPLLQSHPCPLLLRKACTLWGAYTARRVPHEALRWRSCSESNALMTENTPSSGVPLGRVPAPSCTPNSWRESPSSQSPPFRFILEFDVMLHMRLFAVNLRTVRRRPEGLLSIPARHVCKTPTAAQEEESAVAQKARELSPFTMGHHTNHEPALVACLPHAKGHQVKRAQTTLRNASPQDGTRSYVRTHGSGRTAVEASPGCRGAQKSDVCTSGVKGARGTAGLPGGGRPEKGHDLKAEG